MANFENELTIVFPDDEEKLVFMRWFKKRGFEAFLKDENPLLECIATYEENEGSEEETADAGYIEIQ